MQTLGIIMNGVSGRMGYRQHLVRSILAIREQGGVLLGDGETRVQLEPLLVGRSEAKLADIAERHGLEHYTSDLDAALQDERWPIYADFQVTKARAGAIRKAIAAGKAIYTEKPIAESFDESLELARLARDAGVKNGVVHDKLYLPGLLKLRRLIDSGFFGRILSVRGEFGYWVFEGDWQPAQRPSWNYRSEDGGGIVVDMFPHWNYVLENLFGRVESVYAKAVTEIPERADERGGAYPATADDAAYAIFELAGGITAQLNSSWTTRVNRDELVEFQVDGTHGSAVVGLHGCKIQPRNATPKPVWNPDLADAHDYAADWIESPGNQDFDNGFKTQWEEFIRHVVEDAPHRYDFLAGARGVLLAEAGLRSSAEGRRVELPLVTLAGSAPDAGAATDGTSTDAAAATSSSAQDAGAATGGTSTDAAAPVASASAPDAGSSAPAGAARVHAASAARDAAGAAAAGPGAASAAEDRATASIPVTGTASAAHPASTPEAAR